MIRVPGGGMNIRISKQHQPSNKATILTTKKKRKKTLSNEKLKDKFFF